MAIGRGTGETCSNRAKLLDPTALRKEGRRALAATDRHSTEVDRHEDQQLRDEEQAALDRARLTWHHNGDGTTSGSFTLPTLAASILVKAVQQVASPRRFAQRAAKAARSARTLSGGLGTTEQVEEQVRKQVWEAFRTADGDRAHRYGAAFAELLEHLPTDKLSGKVAATVVVTVDHERLREQLGAAHLDTGDDLSASEVRRLACNAGILPAILDGESLPLDPGRTERFFTEHQRVALASKYDRCAAEGCDRPYAWWELHHEDPWSRGGRTDLELAVPLCGQHHRTAHDPTYATTIRTAGRGIKTVTFTRRT